MRMNSGMVISALLGKQRTHKSRQGIACRFIGSSRVIYSDRIEDLWLESGWTMGQSGGTWVSCIVWRGQDSQIGDSDSEYGHIIHQIITISDQN